jgi:hypothetical protein
MLERLDSTLRQHRTELEGEVRGRPELLDGDAEHAGHALTAVLGRGAQRGPAAGDILVVGRLEALRRAHAFRRPTRAIAIEGLVERVEHGLGEPGRLAEHRAGGIQRIIRVRGTALQGGLADEFAEVEVEVLERCAVHAPILA